MDPEPALFSGSARAGNPTASGSIAPPPGIATFAGSARAGNPTATGNVAEGEAVPPALFSGSARAGNPTATGNVAGEGINNGITVAGVTVAALQYSLSITETIREPARLEFDILKETGGHVPAEGETVKFYLGGKNLYTGIITKPVEVKRGLRTVYHISASDFLNNLKRFVLNRRVASENGKGDTPGRGRFRIFGFAGNRTADRRYHAAHHRPENIIL